MRALVLAFAVAALALVVACSGKQACSAATCGTCCDSAGECVASTTNMACGSAGNTCSPCGAGFACTSGTCVRTGAGGGSGGSGGSSGGTGGSTAGGSGGSTGGGTGGATGGGTGTAGGGAAGGAAQVTCGTAPAVPTIPITFPTTCAFPTPCGGLPAGVFHYTSACIPQSEFTSFKNTIEQGTMGVGCGAGTVTVHGYDGGMAGYAFFDGGSVCRRVTGGVEVHASISGFCAQATICNGLNNLNGMMGYGVQCGVDAGLCDCKVSRSINITNAALITTGATTLTVQGTNQTFETCLTGGTMFATRELDAGTAEHEPGVAGLTKQ